MRLHCDERGTSNFIDLHTEPPPVLLQSRHCSVAQKSLAWLGVQQAAFLLKLLAYNLMQRWVVATCPPLWHRWNASWIRRAFVLRQHDSFALAVVGSCARRRVRCGIDRIDQASQLHLALGGKGGGSVPVILAIRP